MIPLSKLHQKHKNEDIYVIGSGPSLDYISHSFLKDKILICVNHTVSHVSEARHIYLLSKEPTTGMQKEIRQKGGILVTCERKFGGTKGLKNRIKYPAHTALFNPKCGSMLDTEQKVSLELSHSSLLSAIHLAAFMGCKAIILVGHDCGTLDDHVHVSNYNTTQAQTPNSQYEKWMRGTCVEHFAIMAKDILRVKYDIAVHSLNPFINFGLEGHKYRSFSDKPNDAE